MLTNDRVNPEGVSNFAGWARMALPISTFSIIEVQVYIYIDVARTIYMYLYAIAHSAMHYQICARGGGGGGGGVVQQPEPRSHWHWSLSNCPPTRNNRSAAWLHTRNCLELGYKSLITPPLHDLAGIYVAISLKGVL